MHTIEKELLVEELMEKTWHLYRESIIGGYMINHSITMPFLDMQCKGIRTAGHYMPKHGLKPATVMINLAYYNGGITTNLECTIAHELAHHITHCIWPHCTQWHGPEFRMVMQSIGYDGLTYHSMSVSKAKAVASKAKDELFDL